MMLRSVVLIAFCLVFTSTAFSQTPCVKFKHIEFFVPADLKVPNWSTAQLTELIALKTEDSRSFFVPFIVRQLGVYQPGCGSMQVDERFELLIKLYSTIRPDTRLVAQRSAEEKLELIRDDFYKQINDDRLFDGLIYTMDDGPLMGKIVSVSSVKPLASREHATPFGKIRFANFAGGVAVLAIDKRGKSLWTRVLGGTVPKRALREGDLQTLTVEQTDFVIVARLIVDGERLTLYTRPNGPFMFYRHSW